MSRERNTGWERVRIRGRTTVRDRVSLHVDPRRTYSGSRDGQQQNYKRENWRDKKDVSSFYFTRFPVDITEQDMWQSFRMWGDLREIFISKKKNRNGRRYGFARFKGVNDAHKLARQLDQIVIGGLKLYVNIPKYGRDTAMKTVTPSIPFGHEGKQPKEAPHRGQHQATRGLTLYAAVVARDKYNAGQPKVLHKEATKRVESRSSLLLNIPLHDKQWFRQAWVGRLKDLRWYDRLEEDPQWDFGVEITPKYMGDDMVLLLGLTDDTAKRMVNEVVEEEDSMSTCWKNGTRA